MPAALLLLWKAHPSTRLSKIPMSMRRSILESWVSSLISKIVAKLGIESTVSHDSNGRTAEITSMCMNETTTLRKKWGSAAIRNDGENTAILPCVSAPHRHLPDMGVGDAPTHATMKHIAPKISKVFGKSSGYPAVRTAQKTPLPSQSYTDLIRLCHTKVEHIKSKIL